jgi:hypothetical protein
MTTGAGGFALSALSRSMSRFPIYLNGKDRRRRKRRLCKADGCPDWARRKGYCVKHAHRVEKYGDPSFLRQHKREPLYPHGQQPEICTEDDCDKLPFARGLCRKHYKLEREWGGHPPRLQLCPMCMEHRYYVELGRGMCCYCDRRGVSSKGNGITHDNGYWNRGTIRAAGEVWCERTGYAPRPMDWKASGFRGDFPCSALVYRHFGTWLALVDELPCQQPPGTRRPRTTKTSRTDCIAMGLVFIARYGYIPTRKQWHDAEMSPGKQVVAKRFGGWALFKLALADATGLDSQ